MRFLLSLILAPLLLSAAAPVEERAASVEERGNGSEVVYIAECHTAGYGSSPAYWQVRTRSMVSYSCH